MFLRFLDQQKQLLEQLGAEKQEKFRQHQLEQHRYFSLQALHEELGHSPEKSVLYHQNRIAMRQQISVLIDSQEQELALAQLELEQKQQSLLAQFKKIKGLESVQKKRDAQLARKAVRAEQRQTDDWISTNQRTR